MTEPEGLIHESASMDFSTLTEAMIERWQSMPGPFRWEYDDFPISILGDPDIVVGIGRYVDRDFAKCQLIMWATRADEWRIKEARFGGNYKFSYSDRGVVAFPWMCFGDMGMELQQDLRFLSTNGDWEVLAPSFDLSLPKPEEQFVFALYVHSGSLDCLALRQHFLGNFEVKPTYELAGFNLRTLSSEIRSIRKWDFKRMGRPTIGPKHFALTNYSSLYSPVFARSALVETGKFGEPLAVIKLQSPKGKDGLRDFLCGLTAEAAYTLDTETSIMREFKLPVAE